MQDTKNPVQPEEIKLDLDRPEESNKEVTQVNTEDRAAFNCAACSGEGLKDQTTLCPACNGTGKV